MSQLSKVLNGVFADQSPLGGVLSDRAIAALSRHRRNAAAMGLLVLAAMLAGVVVAAYSSLLHVRDPGSVKLVAGGLGLSMGAALLLLLRTWKAYSESGLLLILIEDAREDEVRALLNRLIQKV